MYQNGTSVSKLKIWSVQCTVFVHHVRCTIIVHCWDVLSVSNMQCTKIVHWDRRLVYMVHRWYSDVFRSFRPHILSEIYISNIGSDIISIHIHMFKVSTGSSENAPQLPCYSDVFRDGLDTFRRKMVTLPPFFSWKLRLKTRLISTEAYISHYHTSKTAFFV
jgi:hypothetical protein